MTNIIKPWNTGAMYSFFDACPESQAWVPTTFPNGATYEDVFEACNPLNAPTDDLNKFIGWRGWMLENLGTFNPKLAAWHITNGVEYRMTKFKVFNPETALYVEYGTQEEAQAAKSALLTEYVNRVISSSFSISAVVEIDEKDALGVVTATHTTWVNVDDISK